MLECATIRIQKRFFAAKYAYIAHLFISLWVKPNQPLQVYATSRYHQLMRKHKLVCSLLIAATFSSIALAGDEPIVTSDLLRIRTVSSIDVAKDGSKAVFSVRSIAQEPLEENEVQKSASAKYEYRSHLFLLDLTRRSAAPMQLTFGDRSDTSPILSPDGRRIAFVRSDEQASKSQCWIMPIDGGEARQASSLNNGASSPKWSPDGKLLLVSSQIPFDEIEGKPVFPLERPNRDWKDAEADDRITPRPDGTREEIRAWLAQNAKEFDPDAITRLNFQGEHELRGQMQFNHLFLLDPDEPQSQAVQVTNGFANHNSATFMPDGQSILYVSNKPRDEHPDRVQDTQIWRINIDGSRDHMFLAIPGWSLRSPEPSPDGTLVGFIGRQNDEPSFRQRQLGVVSASEVDSREPTWMVDNSRINSSVWGFDFKQNNDLIFTTPKAGSVPLMAITFGLIEPVIIVDRVNDHPIGVTAFDEAAETIVYAVTSPMNPSVLLVRDARGDRLAYDLNPWVADKKLSMPEEGWISRPDGTRVQYWFMHPTNRKSTEKYPMVLEIHGGPAAMWGPGESSMWLEFQLLCSWGYAVTYANPRGSGGYGYKFQRGNYQNWGEGPAGDVLAVVDEVLNQHDWLDENKLAVTGGSYAGYLTAWIVGNDHRFKAAVAQRGVYDLATFFGEGNAWQLVEWAMGGNPYDDRFKRIIQRNSPITYVNRIRTPLLIMHSSNDLRTGVSQSEMLYRSLKSLDRPVEYVRYPNAGHDLSRTGNPRQRMDRLNRIIEFFERYIDNPRQAPVVVED